MLPDDKLEGAVAALGDLSRDELANLWQRTYGCRPPKGVRRELLIKAAAWHLQAKRLGGLSPETRRLLKAATDEAGRKLLNKRSDTTDHDDERRDSRIRTRQPLVPGTRLIRDWNARSHVIDVTETGYVFEAKVYPSLTAIARKITGTQWSGPRFFRL